MQKRPIVLPSSFLLGCMRPRLALRATQGVVSYSAETPVDKDRWWRARPDARSPATGRERAYSRRNPGLRQVRWTGTGPAHGLMSQMPVPEQGNRHERAPHGRH